MPFKITSLPSPEKEIQRDMQVQQPSPLNTAARGVGRTIARAGETIAGLPGDILQTAGTLGTAALRKIDPTIWGMAPEFASPLPTSETLKKGTEAIFGEHLKPQTPEEKAYDDFVSDFTALVSPGFVGKSKFIKNFGTSAKKAFGIAGAGNLVSYLSKEVGVGEGGAEALKIGTMLGTSFGIKGGINRAIKNAYKTAGKVVPGQATISSKAAYDSLLKLEEDIGSRAFEGKDKILGIIQSMLNAFKEGKNIDFNKAWTLTKDANTWYPKLGSAARSELHNVIEIFNKDIFSKATSLVTDSSLKPLMKEASEGILYGNKLYTDQRTSSRIRQWINDNVTLGKFTSGGLISHYLGLPTKEIGAFVTGVKGGVNFLEPIIRSPDIRKVYANTLKTGLRENLPATVKNIQKLDEKLRKEYPELVSQYSAPQGRFKITSMG